MQSPTRIVDLSISSFSCISFAFIQLKLWYLMYTHLKQLWLLNEVTYLILNTKKCPSRADIENKLVDTVGEGVKVKVLVVPWCQTLCDLMNCSPSGSSAHGILQARILEWVAISFSRGSSRLRDRTLVSCIAGELFTVWATRAGEGEANWESSMETYTLPYVKQIASGKLLYDVGTQAGTLWQLRGVGWRGRWEGGLRGRGHMYTYGWLMLRFDRKQNSLKQLSFNLKNK